MSKLQMIIIFENINYYLCISLSYLLQNLKIQENQNDIEISRYLHLYFWFKFVSAREGSRALQALTGEQRAVIINKLADLLLTRQTDILKANQIDVDKAYTDGENQYKCQICFTSFSCWNIKDLKIIMH